MNHCTINFEHMKNKPRIVCPAKIMRKQDKKVVVHPYHNEIDSIMFHSSSKNAKIYAGDGIFDNIDIYGYREWMSDYEISLNIKTLNAINDDHKRQDEEIELYRIHFNGYIRFFYDIYEPQKELNINLNSKHINLHIREDLVWVDSDHSVCADVDMGDNELDLDGDLVNIGISDPIQKINIDGEKPERMYYLTRDN